MNIVKVGWSGGKDSTCSVLLHLEQGDTVKAVCYIPMFTETIPLITKNHYEFILKTADRLRKMGVEVYIVNGMSYYDFVTHRVSKGVNKGKIMGFPGFIPRQCSFKNYSKIKAVHSTDVGLYDYEDIGIAFDEPDRLSQLTECKRSILVENQFTEKMAKQKCVQHNMLSPHYDNDIRDGCALCPNAHKKRRLQWFLDYPEAIQLVIDLQEIVKREKPDRPPLRQHKFFIDTEQVDMFGNYTIN
jgi:hypothetical protein